MTVSTDRATHTEARLDQLRALHLDGGSAADLRHLCRSWRLTNRQGRRLLAFFAGDKTSGCLSSSTHLSTSMPSP